MCIRDRVQHGRCYHYDGTWYYEPGNYAANASGLWAIINGEAAFNVNGVYTAVSYTHLLMCV